MLFKDKDRKNLRKYTYICIAFIDRIIDINYGMTKYYQQP